jgi:hypothetical protein
LPVALGDRKRPPHGVAAHDLVELLSSSLGLFAAQGRFQFAQDTAQGLVLSSNGLLGAIELTESRRLTGVKGRALRRSLSILRAFFLAGVGILSRDNRLGGSGAASLCGLGLIRVHRG